MAVSGQSFQSSIDYVSLGDRLRAYRVGAGLQAEEVAARLGVSRAVVYRMEKGEIVKIETLERLALLLGTSLGSVLGVEVEYYANALGLFERMRQLEQSSERIFAHFEPISQLLTSEAYLQSLRTMLLEAVPRQTGGVFKQKEADEFMRIIAERRAWFESKRPHLVALIGLQELQRFVQLGVVGRLKLPEAVRRQRQQQAVREVERIAELMENAPLNVQIGLIDDVMPSSTFQLCTSPHRKFVTVSPFRLGELPNVRNGIATVTASPEAVKRYENMINRLWRHAYKGEAGAKLLRRMLDQPVHAD